MATTIGGQVLAPPRGQNQTTVKNKSISTRARKGLATLALAAITAASGLTEPASAQGSGEQANPCDRRDFELTYRNDFGPRDSLAGWSIYEGPGHAGNGLRSRSTVEKKHHKLVITARNEGGVTVSGGLAHRGLSQKYGCYRFRVRTDHDYSKVTSGVVMTWPTERIFDANNRYISNKVHGENDIYETSHRFPKRKPFWTFIHRPGDMTSNSADQHWYRHDAQADRYQVMTMVWTPDKMVIHREGLDTSGRISRDQFTVRPENIPHVAHHPAIQLDARNKGALAGPVRLEMDWIEVYDYQP